MSGSFTWGMIIAFTIIQSKDCGLAIDKVCIANRLETFIKMQLLHVCVTQVIL